MLFNALTSLIHGCIGRDRPSVAVLPITADTCKSSTCTAEQWKICNMLLYDTEPPWDWVQTVQCSATTQRQFLDHIQLWSPSLWGNGISYAYQTLSGWKQITKLHLLYMSYNTRYTLCQCKAAFLETLTIILNFNNILMIGRDNPRNSILMTLHYP